MRPSQLRTVVAALPRSASSSGRDRSCWAESRVPSMHSVSRFRSETHRSGEMWSRACSNGRQFLPLGWLRIISWQQCYKAVPYGRRRIGLPKYLVRFIRSTILRVPTISDFAVIWKGDSRGKQDPAAMQSALRLGSSSGIRKRYPVIRASRRSDRDRAIASVQRSHPYRRRAAHHPKAGQLLRLSVPV